MSNIIVGEGLPLPLVKLTPIGEMVKQSIKYINDYYNDISVEKYTIMPNHIHLIITKQTGGHKFSAAASVGAFASQRCPPDTRTPPLQVYDIIGRFKSFTDSKYNGTLWQRSFHDHIIRSENDYLKIWNYIDTNPQKWNEDGFYTE